MSGKSHEQVHFFYKDIIRVVAIALALLLSRLQVWHLIAGFDFIAIIAIVIGGFPMFKESYESILKRRMTMELSMSLAVIATMLIQQYFTGLVFTFFVLIAERLEHLLVAKGRNVIEKLMDILPRKETIRKGNEESEFDVSELKAGDIVIIKPGSAIPVDGIIVKGNSFVDQASLTGESVPVEKLEGFEVFAGTLNQTGILEVCIKRVGLETTFGKVIRMIENAEKSRAPIQKTADKLAARLVYLAFAGAGITLFFTHNIVSAIAALIAAGACGVAAGTPLAILAGIGRIAKEGIVAKGGIYLEQLAKVDTIIFDKTGTLTLGLPTVIGIKIFNNSSHEKVLQLAASIERHSEHPIAKAIITHAKTESITFIPYDAIEYLPGKGMIATIDNQKIVVGNIALINELGIPLQTEIEDYLKTANKNTTVFVGENNHVIGVINVTDVLRSEAKLAVEQIKKMGCHTILLTGDDKIIAHTVAETLVVDEVFAEMLPADKLEHVRKLMQQGKKVAMIGDGINDAASLMEASVGIAMANGADVTLESADMTIMNNNLLNIADAIRISRQCMHVIMFNFWGTVLVDLCGISLAFMGYINPLGAALIHVISELIFILNSARLFAKQR